MSKRTKYNPSKHLYSLRNEGTRIVISCRIDKNGDVKIHDGFSNEFQPKTKGLFTLTTDGGITHVFCKVNKKSINIKTAFIKSSDNGMKNNKYCDQYLGIHIAERILSHIYPNVERMPINNPGYDFICGKGFKVDVKSGCLREDQNNRWLFHINKNIIADYFMCLAFDNREDLNPLHIWLIPGHILNFKTTVTINKSTLNKWSQYEQPLDKVISCCDSIR